MPTQQKPKGANKLRRCGAHAVMYAAQFRRTARNKIRRLKKRMCFDPTAGQAIKRIESAWAQTPGVSRV